MTTSRIAPVGDLTPGISNSESVGDFDIASALTNEIASLANHLYTGGPIAHSDPSAATMGGGASPSAALSLLPGPSVPFPADAPPTSHDHAPYFLQLAGAPTPGGNPPSQAFPVGGLSPSADHFGPIGGTPPGLSLLFGNSPAGLPHSAESSSTPSFSEASPPAHLGGYGTEASRFHDTHATDPRERSVSTPHADEPRHSRIELHEFSPELVPELTTRAGLFDAHAIKKDFPILDQEVNGRPLVWLDNGATTQKPRAVIERIKEFYERENSNVHRGAHTLAARASDAYEAARDKVRRFLNAPSPRDIIFVRGATEGINLIAQSWGRRNIVAGDEIVITWLEHHANIVPWQQLCAEKGAKLKVAPVDSDGQIILEEYEKLLGRRTRLVSLTQVSNALGTIVPAREIVAMAHRHGARVLVDGAQAVSHMPVDVQELDCDFYTFSGHKIFAPTGIGAVFGKGEVLEHMPPWQGGGNMIADVTFEKTAYQGPPARFEAGTGSIADAVGLGAALDYVSAIGLSKISRYEHELRVYAEGCLRRLAGLRIIGTAREKAGVISFTLDGIRTEDVGGALDKEGIAVRSGHHCAQPILRRFGVEATVRASLAPYNTREDIDRLVAAVRRLQEGPGGVPRTK